MLIHTAQDARAIANYFLDLAKKEGRTIDPMGIQKLVYFANGWHLALYGKPLIHQSVEVWDYGPVIRDLYHDFKRFGNGPITEPATELVFLAGMQVQFTTPQLPADTAPETKSLLDRVWNVYKPFTSIQLSNMTHAPGSPWRTARDQGRSVIPDLEIAQWFTRQMNAPQ